MASQQGTGRHPHKSSEEPFPHTKGSNEGQQSGMQAGGRGERSSGSSSNCDDLKAREYRDNKGQIHHHTRTYMRQHGCED